jgi:hypothetical protein
MKYELANPSGSSFEADGQVDCRVLMKSEVPLGWFTSTKNEKKSISLALLAKYYLDTACLLVLWSLTDDRGETQHRSTLMSWDGGLPIYLQLGNYIDEALEWSAHRLEHPDFAIGKFFRERQPWTPRDEFAPVMRAVLGRTTLEYDKSTE